MAVDAIGPGTFTFEEPAATIAAAVGTPFRPVRLPPATVSVVLRVPSLLTRDVVLTRGELDGLMAEPVMVEGEHSCPTEPTADLRENAGRMGRRYHSALARRRPVRRPALT